MQNEKIPFLIRRFFSHPWMPMAIFLPVSVLLTYLSLHFHLRSGFSAAAWIFIGLMATTLVEYLVHRYVFHWTETSERWRAWSHAASGFHTKHHAKSDQEDLIVAPPVLTLAFAIVLYFLFSLVTWSFSTAALIESGLFVGFIVYEWAHYGAHRFIPKSKIGKYLRKYHLQHHFRNPDRQYGVTNPFWDIVFQTR
jgi:sterol desaturase/sphingolipid hydroxylase (fatty acid hydroxylase superfamily)